MIIENNIKNIMQKYNLTNEVFNYLDECFRFYDEHRLTELIGYTNEVIKNKIPKIYKGDYFGILITDEYIGLEYSVFNGEYERLEYTHPYTEEVLLDLKSNLCIKLEHKKFLKLILEIVSKEILKIISSETEEQNSSNIINDKIYFWKHRLSFCNFIHDNIDNFIFEK